MESVQDLDKKKICQVGHRFYFLPHLVYLAMRMSDDKMEYANSKQPKVMHCIVFGNIVLSKTMLTLRKANSRCVRMF